MPLTAQKLQVRIAELGMTLATAPTFLTSVFVAPAIGPMTPPPARDDEGWLPVEAGQLWGLTHGTSWLATTLSVPKQAAGQLAVLRLLWDMPTEDSLLRLLEATAYLDGRAIGGFDSKHRELVLPERACDGQTHELAIQVYTRNPMPFGGLTLHTRYETIWQLYHMMQTLLEVYAVLQERDIARHVLLERLNTAYNMLDLRRGWQSVEFYRSAGEALAYLQAQMRDEHVGGERPHVLVNGHAHLDVAWQWPYWRTRQKIAHTVSNVLALMERYPYYYYSQSQPQLLQWLKEDVPEMYARVKQRVAEGRFEPVGAMWVEADCNLTSGESLVRQILHGTRFMQQEFGLTPRLIWLPDVFGYSAAMPQIMRCANIHTFMTTKISWNQFNRLPSDTFRWRGIDGSEVLAHFITAPDVHETVTYYTYNGPLRPEGVIGTWTNYRQKDINDQLLYLAGWGDGGGGPSELQLERVPIMADLPDFPTVSMGRADEYFEQLYKRVWHNPHLPTWAGELYLEYHRGTYTSQARTKQANRRSELLYRDVELLNCWASLYAMPSRQQRLNEGWRLILLNQFHDVLPGSSIHEVYEDTERIYAEVRTIGEEIQDEALTVLRQRLNVGSNQLLLLNTLPWERTEPIQLAVCPVGDGKIEDVPGVQKVITWDGETQALVDGLRVPSCGALVINSSDIGRSEATGSEATCSAETGEGGLITLHNDYYELAFAANGEIRRLYDKRAQREVLAPGQAGNQLVAFEDRPLTYDAWDIDIFYEEKPYPLREAAQVRLVESGPLRATVEVVRPFLSSCVRQRISLWRSSPRIDFATEIDWHEHQLLLKVAFPVAINSTQATYEIQFGSVERPTHRNTSWDMARFEVAAHRWADLSEGGYGVSLLNDSKYGYDIHNNVMRLTLLKSGINPDPQADQGLHRFTYSLLPHVGDWREAQTVRHAYELNVPISASVGVGEVQASNGSSYSFVSTDCDHIVVETVKPAEDGDGLIVRLYEAHNQRGRCSITFAHTILSAQECNLLEETIGGAQYTGSQLDFQVRPFEIKTFRVRLARSRVVR
ncbi:MAG TPA: alpha-mannosidase [Ktedonobacteraceae bacterium]|nr:alpha-mannosidase [Ktedonobacteraceae bacterium]